MPIARSLAWGGVQGRARCQRKTLPDGGRRALEEQAPYPLLGHWLGERPGTIGQGPEYE